MRWSNVGLVFGQRRRRWANVSPTLGQRIVFAGISSIFDPLGLVAPFLLQGKIILQELCVENKGWDDPICDEVRIKWEKWRNQLPELERLQILLCYNKPADLGKLKCVETHHFSDTCQTDHGERSYLRLIDIEDKVACCLVMSESRVYQNDHNSST